VGCLVRRDKAGAGGEGRKRFDTVPEGSDPSEGRMSIGFVWVPPRVLARAMWVPRPGLCPGPCGCPDH
jgi:hypothetical protein